MGSLIRLDEHRNKRAARPAAASGRSADIILYTGIQYVRYIGPETAPERPNDHDSGAHIGPRRRRKRA